MVIKPYPQTNWKICAAEILLAGGAMAARYFWDKWSKERKMQKDMSLSENNQSFYQEYEGQFPFGKMDGADGSRMS